MSMVRIHPLVIDGNELLPAFSLGKEISRYGSSAVEVYKTAPTLAQLRHAYATNAEIRANVLANRSRGECTSTFLRDGKEAVEKPDEVVYENGLWVAKGGIVRTFDHFSEGRLPPNGWTLKYDYLTGFPCRTGSREDAEKIFGDDASYFWIDEKYLQAFGRGFFSGHDKKSGPFDIRSFMRLNVGDVDIGSRSVIQ